MYQGNFSVRIIVCSLFTLLILACSFLSEKPGTTAIPFLSPSQLAATPTLSPAEQAATLISAPDYLQECKQINPNKIQEQVSYHNIYPGKTKVDEVVALLGNPNKKTELSESEEWEYDEVSIYVSRNIVKDIYFRSIKPIPKSILQLVSEYGCPDIVFADDTQIEPTGDYDSTIFVYFENGFNFSFNHFPVESHEIPDDIHFFKPLSREESLLQIRHDDPNEKDGKPVFWSEAVK